MLYPRDQIVMLPCVACQHPLLGMEKRGSWTLYKGIQFFISFLGKAYIYNLIRQKYIIAKLSQVFYKPLSLIKDSEIVILQSFWTIIIFLLYFCRNQHSPHHFFFPYKWLTVVSLTGVISSNFKRYKHYLAISLIFFRIYLFIPF